MIIFTDLLLTMLNFILKMRFSRRFSASFSQLRLHHRRIKNSRNPDLVHTWESQTYNWPVKDNPPELVILATSEGLEEGEKDEEEEDGEEEEELEHGVTMSGRSTGEQA